jgi:hypothetical protein
MSDLKVGDEVWAFAYCGKDHALDIRLRKDIIQKIYYPGMSNEFFVCDGLGFGRKELYSSKQEALDAIKLKIGEMENE